MSATFPQPFGKYVLLNKIALGGMAEIFRAKTVGIEGFEKEVVIKRILPHFTEDEAFRTMFIDEATLAAKLHHANIVQIYDFDIHDGMHYIAMEYVEGKDLKKIQETARKQGKHLSVGHVTWIMAETAKGLHYAHTRKHRNEPLNIVHRDVSPHNVMVSYNGEVKLMDFGIAKAASRYTKTRAGTVKGKCAYMSPEQAKGQELDGRSDLFSLGVVMWELLTDKRLFAGETDFETLSNVLKCEVPPPSTHNKDVPEGLDEILLKALSRDPNDRYADCGAFYSDTNRFFYGYVQDVDAVRLEPFMRDLFENDIEALATMQAQERTVYITSPSSSGSSAPRPTTDDEAAPTIAMPTGSFSNDAPTMAVDAAQFALQRGASQTASGPMMASGTHQAFPTGTHTGSAPKRGAGIYVLVGLLIAALGLVGFYIYLEYGGGPKTTTPTGGAVARTTGPAGGPETQPEPEAPTVGVLTVVPTPAEAKVFVNDEELPDHKLEDVKLGTLLAIRIEFEGREAKRVVTMSSTAQTEMLEVTQATQAPPATVTIQAPSDVTLRVSGKELGKGSQKFTAKEGDEVIIDAFREGGEPYQRRMTITNDGQMIAILDTDVPQPPKVATVSVDVSPDDASVLVNGKPLELKGGKAVLSDYNVGDTLTIEATAKGHRSEKKELKLEEEQIALPIKLRKEGGGSSEPAASGQGSVSINARPWADVFYKGRKIGVTPVSKKSFPAGHQKFTLKKGDVTKTVTIEVVKDKLVTKVYDMTN